MRKAGIGSNSSVDWDRFSPRDYLEHNYAEARKDDIEFVSTVGDFFLDQLRGRQPLRGVDVGPGANLYPALAMLPFCKEITLIERSVANCRWLRKEVAGYSSVWNPFWDVLSVKERYHEVTDPVHALAGRARVRQGSIFALPRDTWEVGTMFFVAESMSADMAEFREGLRRFIGSLVPGAPFAAGFMENSQGYEVDGLSYPAVAVSEHDIREGLRELAEDDLKFTFEAAGTDPLRHGYTGMILVCGRKRQDETET